MTLQRLPPFEGSQPRLPPYKQGKVKALILFIFMVLPYCN